MAVFFHDFEGQIWTYIRYHKIIIALRSELYPQAMNFWCKENQYIDLAVERDSSVTLKNKKNNSPVPCC